MSSCHTFRPVPGQCGPRGRGPLPAPPFDPQDYWATRKLVSSLFGSLDTTKLDKVDVVDPSAETEAGKAADAKSTYEKLNRILGIASDAQELAESKADQSALEAHVARTNNPHAVTANQVGAYTKDETNTRLDEKADKATTVAGYGITDAATKTEIAAKADLVGGKIPAAQLPSYVDDVLEYDTMSAFPTTGESGKIYVAKDTSLVYRWSGTQYVEISPSPAFDNTVTETSQNGVKSSGIWSWVKSLLPRWLTNDYAEPATVASVATKADKSVLEAHVKNTNNPHAVTASQVGAYTKSEVNTKLDEKADKSALEAHVASTNNPHGVTAGQVGAYTKAEVNTKLDEKANKATTLSGYGITDAATKMDMSELDMQISNLTDSLNYKLDKQYGNASIGWDDSLPGYFRIKNAILDLYSEYGGTYGIQIGGNTLLGDVWQLTSTLRAFQKIQLTPEAQLTFLDDNWNEESIEDRIKRLSSLAPKYSTSSAYSVGQYVFHDGSIYRCTTAIALPGEAWNPAHWSEAQKLDDFFTESNSLLNGRLAYSRNATGLKDRAFNALTFDGTEYNLSTALAAVTPTASGQPRDLLIVATATAATTISFTAGTIKGDKPTIDGSGTWLITLTEYASGVWYCRQIKMEDAA